MSSKDSKKEKKKKKRRRNPKGIESKTVPKHIYDDSYAPGLTGSSAGPFPMKKKTKRKRKDTYRQN
ncbi:MAG: hypothetical protein ACXAAP_13680 [Candidatus Thorarchaeota archaeon]